MSKLDNRLLTTGFRCREPDKRSMATRKIGRKSKVDAFGNCSWQVRGQDAEHVIFGYLETGPDLHSRLPHLRNTRSSGKSLSGTCDRIKGINQWSISFKWQCHSHVETVTVARGRRQRPKVFVLDNNQCRNALRKEGR